MAMVSGAAPESVGDSMRLCMARSYGAFASLVEGLGSAFVHILVLTVALTMAAPSLAEGLGNGAKPIKMVVLGDSLSAGLGLSANDEFPAKLQKALNDKGINVDITNAGVSG